MSEFLKIKILDKETIDVQLKAVLERKKEFIDKFSSELHVEKDGKFEKIADIKPFDLKAIHAITDDHDQ